tara:strand:- start:838 stop:1104 length:267 start_codon:yes stop_codon:yes gene_type:complete
MLPTLNQGDLLIYKPFNHKKDILKEGEIVILKHPKENRKLIVKRVSKVTLKNIKVIGDNEFISIDSRHFGLISFQEVKGVVEKIISKK